MSKKRVHELAKDAGLDNREAVEALRAAGISVKTHSSSVYEEEALAVLNKIKEPAPAAPSRRPGMMIVKKRRDSEAEAEAAAPAPAAAEPTPVAAAEAVPAQQDAAPELAVTAAPAAESAPVVAAAETAPPPPEAAVEVAAEAGAAPAVSAEGETAEAPAAEASPEPRIEERVAQRSVADTAGGKRVEVESVRRQEVRPGTPGAPVPGARPTVRSVRPTSAPATVVRMIDRDKLLERVPGRRLGNNGGGAPRPSGAGGQRFGQVTELKVVTDPFGRGREMVPLGRDKKAKGGPGLAGAGARGGPPGRKGRAGGKPQMMDMRERSLHPSRLKRKKAAKRLPGNLVISQPKASKRVIKMKETIVVSDLAHELGIKAVDIIRKLMALGTMVTQNQSVDFATAQVIAAEYEYTVDSVAFAEDAHIEVDAEAGADAAAQAPRPPVVTVMGHVDHGKTSLLDAIRKARVASGEAGGITQHIGAYQVPVPGRGSVTFLDTPGHAAFTSMRARGAQVTDIVILVVAADDGVMPQTEEAIRHAQAAKVPIIVAVNKIDRPDANADRVMQELTKFELLPEAWGGDTLYVPTSATQGTGIPELLEAVMLQAEVLELRANADRPAIGVVVEAQLDRGRGPVATVLVQQGTLRRGDAVVVGRTFGKIRAMVDDQGRQLKEAGPSAAVEFTGLDAVPEAGDALNTVENADSARQVAEHRAAVRRTGEQAAGAAVSLDDLMKRMEGASTLELKLVLKADVQGSVEALRGALEKLSTAEVRVNVIYGGVGGIKESDIMLAAASGGLVLGFGVRPDSGARATAEREGVEIRTYSIIYEAVDEVTRAMEGLLTPEAREKVVGRAEVRELFKVSKVGTIGGCRVLEGKASRSARVRVLRDSVQVYEGKVSSLRHFKNDAREVDAGNECGVGVEGYNDLKNGDVIEFFLVEEIARTLTQAPAAGRRPAGGAEAHP